MSDLLVFRDKSEARRWVQQRRRQDATVGLVPTMGALHEGHFSLVRQSVERCDATVATIFVNPTQFAPDEDLAKYPRTLEADLEGLRSAGADAVFVPAADTMYGPEHSTYITPPNVAANWEGAARPEHFRGVTTVVLKLFHILPTSDAFFGQKDFQQAAVIRAMADDLDLDMQIHVCPIVREPDGLAMSSRNRYLSQEERQRALGLSRALLLASRQVAEGERDPRVLSESMHQTLLDAGVDQIDYATVVDGDRLTPLTRLHPHSVAIIAARVGQTRLIDNHVLTSDAHPDGAPLLDVPSSPFPS